MDCPAGSYFVRPGDTCWGIVQGPFYGFPRRLESANWGFKCCDRKLYVGEEICLWQSEPRHPCALPPCAGLCCDACLLAFCCTSCLAGFFFFFFFF